MSDDIERLIAAFETPLRGKPGYAMGLAGLAEVVWNKGHKQRAAELARAALGAGAGDARVTARARKLLSAMLRGYHIPMMNDARRNAAWDKALRAAIRPGMHVFEIGTGAGMLALMAARAGAASVTTCERDPLVADLAREIAARNGYADRLHVVTKRSQDVALGADLAQPADLLFCDIFGDSLFNFDPFTAIADAKTRLLTPGAQIVPAAVSLHVALADWAHYGRAAQIGSAAGFDLSPLADFAAAVHSVKIGDPDLRLLSAPRQMHRAVLTQPFPLKGEATVTCTASQACEVNGIARWIKLELDGDTTLEARPQAGAVFFSNPTFLPLPRPLLLRQNAEITIATSFAGDKIETWCAQS